MEHYEFALVTAGAKVHAFESFGSYQGDWWALVTHNGKTGWVNGTYGSCRGCDAFYAQFDYMGHDVETEDPLEFKQWHYPDENGFTDGCPQCENIKIRLAEFGLTYLDTIMSQEEAVAKASENIEWDYDARGMLVYIVAHAIKESRT